MEMTRSCDLAIRTRGLRKVFSGKMAVRNLTLDVPRGEVFGFLGPNGAGKSTSVKMLLGLVFPSGGEAQVLGYPAGDVKTRSRIGFLPSTFASTTGSPRPSYSISTDGCLACRT